MSDQQDLRALRGLVATAVLTGLVTEEFSESLSNMRAWAVQNGFTNVEWRRFACQLVEAGRDAICQHALNPRGDGSEKPYDWILMADADALFPPDALGTLLHTAYIEHPDSDVVGAYVQLKHPMSLPAIDTGTGTWEPIFPGEGTIPVIRTGGHFLLIKTRILTRFGPPWFRTRRTLKPVDVLSELDNFARMKFDGENPLQEHEAWGTLSRIAHEEAPRQNVASVGEDSGFCDAVKAAGGTILVNTNVVTGHVAKKIIGPKDLKNALEERERSRRLRVGVLE